MASSWAILLCVIRTAAAARQTNVFSLAEPTCADVEVISNPQIKDSPIQDMVAPLGKALKKCKSGRLGAWKGSHILQVMHQEGFVQQFAEELGLELALTQEKGEFWPFFSTFKLCFQQAPGPPVQNEYQISKKSSGQSVLISGCDNNRILPHGVAGQPASKSHGTSRSGIKFNIRYQLGDMPMAVWKILDDADAVDLHTEFAEAFNRKTDDSAASTLLRRSYMERFREEYGIGLYFFAEKTYCRQELGVAESIYRWLEYADLHIVGYDYDPIKA